MEALGCHPLPGPADGPFNSNYVGIMSQMKQSDVPYFSPRQSTRTPSERHLRKLDVCVISKTDQVMLHIMIIP